MKILMKIKYVGSVTIQHHGILLKVLSYVALRAWFLRTVPTIVTAHTFCASPYTRISYRQCLLIQGYFCAV